MPAVQDPGPLPAPPVPLAPPAGSIDLSQLTDGPAQSSSDSIPGPGAADPGWAGEVFHRPIEKLEFFLPTGHVIVLAGMAAYNFFIEAMQSMTRKNFAQVKAFWFCDKLPDQPTVEMWRVGDGKVVYQQRPLGREWGGGAGWGWKKGRIDNVVSRIE